MAPPPGARKVQMHAGSRLRVPVAPGHRFFRDVSIKTPDFSAFTLLTNIMIYIKLYNMIKCTR